MNAVYIKNIGATSSTQVVTFLQQLLLLPFFLKAWGIPEYGEWLLLTALPGYFILFGDFGFTTVGANELAFAVQRGDRQGEAALFQTLWIANTILFVVTSALYVTLLTSSEFATHFHIQKLIHQRVAIAMRLAIVIFMTGQIGVLQGALRARRKFAEGILAANACTLAEVMGSIILLIYHASPSTIASVTVVGRTFAVLALTYLIARTEPATLFGFRKASFHVWRQIAPKALFFMAFPLGNALMLQGPILIISNLLGPVPTAIYATCRTGTRLLLQATGALTAAVSPEISRHHGDTEYSSVNGFPNHSKIEALYFSITQLTFFVAIIFGSLLLSFRVVLFSNWVGHGLVPAFQFAFVMFLAAAMISLRSISDVTLTSMNKHIYYAKLYLPLSLGYIISCWWLTRAYGLKGTALALLISESCLTITSHVCVWWTLGITYNRILEEIRNPQLGRFVRRAISL